MKKFVLTMAAAAMALSVAVPAVAEEKEITIMVDEKAVASDQPAVIEEGRTLVPVRAIFEALGAEITWDEETKTVTATKGEETISLEIGKNEMKTAEGVVALDVPAQIIGDRTMVPARAVAEAFEAEVLWDADTYTVSITSKAEETETEPETKPEEDKTFEGVTEKTIENVVKSEDGETELLNISVKYPEFEGADKINAAVKQEAENFAASMVEQYQKDAEEVSQALGEDFRAYVLDSSYEITFMDDKMVSYVVNDYMNLNGAHPMSQKTGYTFDLESQKQLGLTDVLEGTKEEIQEIVINAFNEAIDKEDGIFFAEAKDTVKEKIEEVQFYVAEDGVHFFFQLYEVAPYAAGYQEIVVVPSKEVTPAEETVVSEEKKTDSNDKEETQAAETETVSDNTQEDSKIATATEEQETKTVTDSTEEA